MSVLDHTIKINAPPDKVWEVLADLEAVQKYNPMVVSARHLSSNREGIGASRRCDLKPKGHVRERVIGWEPKKAITMELVESPWPIGFMRWRPELRPDGAGTIITQRIEYRLKFGLLGRILDALLMRRMLNKGITDTLVNLKRFIEAGSVLLDKPGG
jgi:ligand-binding SRPBCC domain-containing protein